MPETEKFVESFSASSPIVLIINELGAIGSHLADSLLSLGCRLYYFGNKKIDQIDHLVNKDNFILINSLAKVNEKPLFNYVFYLADSKRKQLTQITKIIKGERVKFLLTFQESTELARKILDEVLPLEIDMRICLFQEMYGPRIETGCFSSILKAAAFGEKIKIPQDGSQEIPLVFYSDFIKGINRAMFAPDTSGKIFNVQGQPISGLNFLAELEKKIKKALTVVFATGEKANYPKSLFANEESGFGWQPEVDLGEGISRTLSWWERRSLEISAKGSKHPKIPLRIPTRRFKKIFFGISLFLFLIFIFFIFPLAVFLFNLFLVKSDLRRAVVGWEKGDLVLAEREIYKATNDVERAKKIFELGSPFYDSIWLEGMVRQTEPILDGTKNFLESTRSFLRAANLLTPLFSSFIKGEKVALSPNVKEAEGLLEKAYLDISLAWSTLGENWENEEVIKYLGLKDFLSKGKISLTDLRDQIVTLKATLSQISELVGEGRERTYLVVLQNNFELRPTGGFISSYGLVEIEDGQLVSFEFKDVSEADNLLRGQVDPPLPIKNYLGEKNWYLKDANWEVDFSDSAEKIKWFYEKETGLAVDGVIGVNLNYTQRILELIGDVYLDSQEKINAQNIFEEVEYSSEPNLLGKLGKAVWQELQNKDQWQMVNLIRLSYSSLKNKDIFFYFFHPQLAELIRLFNWGGSLQKNLGCQKIGENCFEDYIFVNEANLGVNRANFFLKRMISQAVSLTEEGKFSETLKIYYQNQSLSDTWPGGRYKNYLRLLLPEGSLMESVMINDPAEPGFWVQIPDDKIDLATKSGKISLGFLVDVPTRTSRVIEVKYLSSFMADIEKPLTYFLYNQKQSGMGETPFSFSLMFPQKLRLMRVLPKGSYSAGKIVINETLDKDKIFRIDFSR